MAGLGFGGGFVGAGHDQKAHLDAGDGRRGFGCGLGGDATLVLGESLGLGDDEEIGGRINFLIKGEAGLLGGVGLAANDFFDLADDQIFGDVLGGKSKDGGFGIESGIGWQVDDVGLAGFVDVVALGSGLQGNGQFDLPVIEGDDFDNRGLNLFDQTDEGAAGDDRLARLDTGKVLARKDDQISQTNQFHRPN